jgi:hypothetical protein
LQSILTLSIIVFTLLSFSLEARVDKRPFSISINSKTKVLDSFKKRAELKMARSTDFCRGFYMPKVTSTWSCKKTGPGVETCKLTYKCKPTHKNFNRSSEVRKIRSELKKMKVSKQRLRLRVTRKPYKKKSYRKSNNKKLVKKLKDLKAARARKEARIKAPKTKLSKKSIDDELDELAKFNDSDKLDDGMVKSGFDDKLSENLKDELDEELENLNEDVEEKTSELNKKDEDKSPYTSKPAKLAAFSLEMIQISDEFDSLVTLGASWTPRKAFNTKFGMRGQFGLKSIEISSGTSFEETFIVYELGMYLMLNFNPNLFAEVGYVLQKWNNSAGDSVSAFSVGGGYIFTTPVMKIFDRMFIDYSTVSNDTSNRELKFALGISF